MFLPLTTFAVVPTSIVFTQYQENYKLFKNKNAEVVLTLSTEKPIEKPLIIPIAIDNNQYAEVRTSDSFIQASIISIENQVYLQIIPDTTIIDKKNTLTIVLSINNFVKQNGFLFLNKSASIPLISNYPSISKKNVFIDLYSSIITLPGNYKPEKDEIEKSDSVYKINFNENQHSDNGQKLNISAEYLNLHSIKHESIQLSRSFNPIILMVLIIGLLVLYLIYFSSLIKYEEPVQNVSSRY
jgi:hypothetical protein